MGKIDKKRDIILNKLESKYYEAIYTVEDDLLSYESTDIIFNKVIIGLQKVFTSLYLLLYEDFFSFSYGFHYHDNNYLKYKFTGGFNAPNELSIEEFKIIEIVDEISKKKFSENYRFRFAKELLGNLKNFDQIKTFLNKNYFNQNIEVGEYPKFIAEKKTYIEPNFCIKEVDTNSNLPVRILIDYYIVTVLEAFFVSPQYFKNILSHLSRYSSIMFSSPVFLSYQQPIGDIFFTCTYNKEKIGTKKLEKIKSIFKKYQLLSFLRNELGSLCRISYFENIVRKQTTRIAILSVMTRNMSHNSGSHVLSKLLTVKQIMDILKDYNDWQCNNIDEFEIKNKELINELYLIIERKKNECREKEEYKAIEDCFNSIIQPIAKFETQTYFNYSLLTSFFSYLKARMDYLADITTNTPVIENTKGIYNDILKQFIENRVLKDRISGLETFRYKLYACNSQKCNISNCHNVNEQSKCLLKNTEDIIVSIPNDVLGCQAFYTILENIIRNTAKHGSPPKDDANNVLTVDFKIKIEEANSKFSDISIDKTNCSLDEYYCVSIFDNCPNSEIYKLVETLNNRFNEPILKNNQLRYGAWGLIEMNASAAYLLKVPIDQIDNDQFDILDVSGRYPLTREGELAILQAYAEQERYLGYRFFIRKPQEILIVVNDQDLTIASEMYKSENEKMKLLNKYKNEGIFIYNKPTFQEFFKDNKQKVFPHKLIVVVNANDEIKNLICDNKACFSSRVYYRINTIELPKENIDKFKLDLWKEYYMTEKIKFYGEPIDVFQDIQIFKNVKNEQGIKLRAVIENHAKDYCQKQFGKNNDKQDKPYDFIEIWTSSTSHFFADIYLDKSDENFINYYQQWASAPIPVLVLDERIQEFASTNKYSIHNLDGCNPKGGENNCYHIHGGIPYHIIYEKTNVVIPDSNNECNLNAQNYYSEQKYYVKTEYLRIIETFQKFVLKQKTEKHFFIIIHLGIIEKLIDAHKALNIKCDYNKDDSRSTREFIITVILNKEKENKKIKNDLEDLSEYYDHIIVTSGRGTPQNIPQGIRYLNFSIISQYMISLRNKYAFAEALFSARRIN